MDKKQFYEAPEAELLQVRFERNFLESPDQTLEGSGFGDTRGNVQSDNGIWNWMEE